MKNLMLRVLFGGILLISNILTILTKEERALISDSASTDMILPKTNMSLLENEKEYRELLETDENKAFYFVHEGNPHTNTNTNTNISFIITPCKAVEIHWILKYTREYETDDVFDENYPSFEVLSTGTSTENYIFIGKANEGFYKLEINSPSRRRFTYSIYVSLTPAVTQLLSQVNSKSITLKKNLTENSLYIKWPAWVSFKHQIKYTLAISINTFVNSACEIELYGLGYEYVTTQNTSYVMHQRAVLGNTYYVSVFVMYRNSFLLPFLRGSVTFPKSKPIGLKDGIRMKGTLISEEDTLTFRYKVKNHLYPVSNEIYWYVIACNGVVNVEINHKKDAVVKKQIVSKYKIFRIQRPKQGNRYIMKISDSYSDEERHFEVMATMQPERFSLPNVENFTVMYFPDQHYSVKNRARYLIRWYAATDEEPVEYCVYYIMKKNEDEERDESFGDVNQCSMRKYVNRIKEQRLEKPCYTEKPKESSFLQRYLNDLDSTRDYVVFVSARKPRKRRIWYNSVLIRGAGSYELVR